MFSTRKRHFIIATQSSQNKRILLKIDDFVEQNSLFSERTKGNFFVFTSPLNLPMEKCFSGWMSTQHFQVTDGFGLILELPSLIKVGLTTV